MTSSGRHNAERRLPGEPEPRRQREPVRMATLAWDRGVETNSPWVREAAAPLAWDRKAVAAWA